MTGGSALGRISRKMMEISLTPRLRAASTNSRLRRDMNSARTMRAGAVHDTTPMAITIFSMLEPKMATSVSSNTKLGMV